MPLFARLKKNKILLTKISTTHEEQVALLWVTAILMLVSLAVIWDVIRPNSTASYQQQTVFSFLSKTVTEDYNNCVVEVASAAKGAIWQGAGDLFSSTAHIDLEKTDMFLDERTTAFIFPPLYSWQKLRDCPEEDCGLANNSLVYIENNPELTTAQKIAQLPRPLPTEVANREIIQVASEQLASRTVVSFVVQEGDEERGLVYFLENGRYQPLITDATNEQIITKYGRGGGRITVGGEDDNFLILYIGYEGKAFHYQAGKFVNVSRFFGLRVANEGFVPAIIKQGAKENSVWYVVSLSSNKPKLIKLWQNGTNSLVGSYDISDNFSAWLRENNLTPLAFSHEKKDAGFSLLAQGLLGQELWNFQDEGFDNTKKRTVVSVNLNKKEAFVRQAYIRSFGLALGDNLENGYEKKFSTSAQVYLGDSLTHFLPAAFGETINFSGLNQELYWKIELAPRRDNSYSPWLDHFNDLQYSLYK